MNGRQWAGLACLVVIATTASANAETVAVKASTLDQVRPALTHYDLTAGGTVSVLAQLAAFAREHAATKQGEEASFLHAAVAADLLFISDFSGDAALAEAVAGTFGVAREALREQLRAALKRHAQGMYEPPARLALAGLDLDPASVRGLPLEQVRALSDVRDTRSDAALLARALRRNPGAGAPDSTRPLAAQLASLGEDPCPAADSCKPPFAGLDVHSRRALALVYALIAADQRLARGARLGDPLALALAPQLEPLRAELNALQIPLLPRLAAEVAPLAALPVQDSWPQLDGMLILYSDRVAYQRVPSAGVAALQAGAVPQLPALETVATLQNLPSYVRPVDELVAHVRKLREEAPAWSGGVAVPQMVPAHLLSRVLVSLNKAGAKQTLLLARTAAGDVASASLRVLIDKVDPLPARSDTRLRVRLGGYTLTLDNLVSDIPRVQDETGYHFDLPRLYGMVAKSGPKTAAVSFQSDVSAVQLTLAVLSLPSANRPIEFVIQ